MRPPWAHHRQIWLPQARRWWIHHLDLGFVLNHFWRWAL
jgi:hypothetical protein